MGFCTTWICRLLSCRFLVIPGHILLENSNSFVGELSKFIILSINVFVISGDTDLSFLFCELFKDNWSNKWGLSVRWDIGDWLTPKSIGCVKSMLSRFRRELLNWLYCSNILGESGLFLGFFFISNESEGGGESCNCSWFPKPLVSEIIQDSIEDSDNVEGLWRWLRRVFLGNGSVRHWRSGALCKCWSWGLARGCDSSWWLVMLGFTSSKGDASGKL